MPPPSHNKFTSDSLTAPVAPVLDLDALYADLFDGPLTLTDKIPDSALSKDEAYFTGGALTPTNEILDANLFEDEVSPFTSSGDHCKSGSGPARVQVTTKDIPDSSPIKPSSSVGYYLSDTRPALAWSACMDGDDEEEEDERATEEKEATEEEEAKEEEEDEFDINNLPLYPEDSSVPQVCLPRYRPHHPVWRLVDAWMRRHRSTEPYPLAHVPSKYHQHFTIVLDVLFAWSLLQEEADDDTDSSSGSDLSPMGMYSPSQDLPSLSTNTQVLEMSKFTHHQCMYSKSSSGSWTLNTDWVPFNPFLEELVDNQRDREGFRSHSKVCVCNLCKPGQKYHDGFLTDSEEEWEEEE